MKKQHNIPLITTKEIHDIEAKVQQVLHEMGELDALYYYTYRIANLYKNGAGIVARNLIKAISSRIF